MTKKEAAEQLGISTSTVRKLLETGELRRITVKNKKGQAVEQVHPESVFLLRELLQKVQELETEYIQMPRAYTAQALTGQTTLRYADNNGVSGMMHLEMFSFFNVSSPTKVRKVRKLIEWVITPQAVLDEIQTYLRLAVEAIDDDMAQLVHIAKDLANRSADFGAKTFPGKRCKDMCQKALWEYKQLQKTRKRFVDYQALFQ